MIEALAKTKEFINKRIKSIRQPRYSMDCVPAVIAMVTNTKEGDFKDFISAFRSNGNGCYLEIDMMLYLAYRGYTIGLPIEKEGIDFKEGLLSVNCSMDSPALVLVHISPDRRVKHLIYWDGERVYDPLLGNEEFPNIKDYDIYCWWPIVKYTFRNGKKC